MNYDISGILNEKISPLIFMDRIGKVVRVLTFITGTPERPIKKAYPIDCSVSLKDCTGSNKKHTDLVPNSKYKSIHYWEDGGARPVTNSNERDYRFESSLRLVGWLNLNKLGKTDCSLSAKAVLQIINALPSGRFNSGEYKNIQITSISQAPKSAAIFSKYSYDESVTQYLLFPFDYYAIDITIQFTVYKACIEAFTLGEPIKCEEK